MAWRGRYVLNMATDFRLGGGKPVLLILLLLSVALIILGITQEVSL